MHGDDIGVTLHQQALVGLPYGVPGLEDAVQRIALVVNLRFGRIHILCDFLVAGTERAPAEGNDPSGKVLDREHHPFIKTVRTPVVLTLTWRQHQTGLLQIFSRISLVHCLVKQGGAV